jgi:glutathione S-transferase
MLALYHFGPVANSLTPLLCLLEKGLPFENRQLDSRNWDHHTPEFRRVSPQGMVPVLVHDERPLTESSVINEYLDAVFPEVPLRPADPFERAQMRIWVKYVDEYFCPALTVLGAHGAAKFAAQMDQVELARRIADMPDAEVRKKWQHVAGGGFSDAALADARAKLARVADKLEGHLADGRAWLLGEGYSLADIKWYSMVPGLPRMVPELCSDTATPNVMAWLARMQQRPAVRRLDDYRR